MTPAAPAQVRADRTARGAHLGARSRTYASALLRRWWWRAVLVVVGGLSVRGRLPRGGCVVVANHRSHIDTVALLAALDAHHRPHVAAAADYWFSSAVSGAVCRTLAGGFPVHRHGGGSVDLADAERRVRSGQAVVLFAEGTRSRDGGLGEFHTGAARLAERARVPLVGIGLHGTDQVLGVHGRLRLGHPVTVRIGTAMQVDCPRRATDDVRRRIALLADTGEVPDSRRRAAVERLGARRAAGLVAVWAFAEALSWPIVPEVVLCWLLLAAPRWWRLLIPIAILAGTVGGLTTSTLAAHDVRVPAPLTTAAMRVEAARRLADHGAAGVWAQPLSGVPYKVYAREAGQLHLDPVGFAVQSLLARGARTAACGLVFAGLGVLLRRRRQLYGFLLTSATIAFVVGLARVVLGWSGGGPSA